MARGGERAAVPPERVRQHRGHGEGRVRHAQRAGAGDAQRDGQGDGRPGRVPRGVRGRPPRGGVRVAADDQGVAVQVRGEQHVKYTTRSNLFCARFLKRRIFV